MSYYQTDGLGSVTSLSDSKGNLISTYEYDSFGNLLASTGSISNPFRFTGREFDAETGLYFYRARYYDPSIGRFISEDPIRFDAGTNFYTYAANNPILFIDPFGLSGRSIALGIASTTVNTAALAPTWNPPAALAAKVVGAVFSMGAIGNAVYEYATGQMSRSEAAINVGAAAMDVVGPAIGSKIAGALLTGLSRAVCIASTSTEIAQSLGPSSAAAAGAMPSFSIVSSRGAQFEAGAGK